MDFKTFKLLQNMKEDLNGKRESRLLNLCNNVALQGFKQQFKTDNDYYMAASFFITAIAASYITLVDNPSMEIFTKLSDKATEYSSKVV